MQNVITQIKRRIREAAHAWKNFQYSEDRYIQPDFIQGVLYGLKEALRIVQDVHREKIIRIKTKRHPLTRWNAQLLYTACRSAYLRLKQSDRTSAMHILSKALAQIRA